MGSRYSLLFPLGYLESFPVPLLLSISLLSGDSGRCRSVFRGMPITASEMKTITIPG